MAVGYELDSFMRKFRSLCDAGYQASLNFIPVNGQAHLSLNVNLGCAVNGTYSNQNQYFPTKQNKSQSPSKRPPSYFRRQQRRRQVVNHQSTDQLVIDENNDENLNLCDTTEECLIGTENDASEANRNDGSTIDDYAGDRNSAEEDRQDKANNLSEKTADETPSPTAKSKPSVSLPSNVQLNVPSAQENQQFRRRRQDRPSPHPNPECCNHECYPEPDAPDGKCCWHRCGRIPWPWQT